MSSKSLFIVQKVIDQKTISRPSPPPAGLDGHPSIRYKLTVVVQFKSGIFYGRYILFTYSPYNLDIPLVYHIYIAGFKLLNAPFGTAEVVKNSATITNWKCIAKVVFQNESTTPDKVWWEGGGLIHFVLLPKLKVSDYRTTFTTCSIQGSRNCCCYLIGCVLSRYRPRSCCSWWWWWWRRIMILLCNKPLLNYFPYIQKNAAPLTHKTSDRKPREATSMNFVYVRNQSQVSLVTMEWHLLGHVQ